MPNPFLDPSFWARLSNPWQPIGNNSGVITDNFGGPPQSMNFGLPPVSGFGGPDLSMPPVSPGVMPPIDTFNQIPDDMIMQQRMSQLFNPEHVAADRVNALLSQIPHEEKPSFMRKLSASMVAGGGNLGQADRILHDPYNNAMEQWKNQFTPAYQAANLERYSNATERQAAQNQLQYEMNSRKQDEAERNNRVKNQQADEKIEISRKRAEAYDLHMRGWKLMPGTKGGNAIMYNAEGKTYDTGIPLGSLTDYDKINLQQEGRMEVVNAQQAGANQRTQMTQEGANSRQEARGWMPMTWKDKQGVEHSGRFNMDTGRREEFPEDMQGGTVNKIGTPRSNLGSGTTSEFQVKQGRINRAILYKNQHPEMADSIRIENGEVIIDPPSSGLNLPFLGNIGGGSGYDANQYNDARGFIFGPQPMASHGAMPPAGWMYMNGPQGKVKVPADKIEWAKKNGYKPVVP